MWLCVKHVNSVRYLKWTVEDVTISVSMVEIVSLHTGILKKSHVHTLSYGQVHLKFIEHQKKTFGKFCSHPFHHLLN